MIPVNLIPVLSDKFQGFDRASPTVKACTLLRPVLEYLWAVHKNLIQPIMLSKERCIESQDWASRLHFANIWPKPCYHHLSHYHLLLKHRLRISWLWMQVQEITQIEF
jgi:hypothetical protein